MLQNIYVNSSVNKRYYLNLLVLFFFKKSKLNIDFIIYIFLFIKSSVALKKKKIFFNKFDSIVVASKNSFFFKNFKTINLLSVKLMFSYLYFLLYKNNFFNFAFTSNFYNINNSMKTFFLTKNVNFFLYKKNSYLKNNFYGYKNINNMLLNLSYYKKNIIFLQTVFSNLNSFSNINSFYFLYKTFFFLPIYTIIKTSLSSSNFFFNNMFNIIKKLKIKNEVVLKYLNIRDIENTNLNLSILKKINILKKRRTARMTRRLFSNILIRFSESLFKESACFIFDFNPYRNLSNYEWSMLEVFMRRLAKDRRMYWKLNTRNLQKFRKLKKRMKRKGDVIYWKELISCCFLCLKLRDATFFLNYLVKKSNRMSLYRHRFFFSRIFNIFKTMFFDLGPFYNLVGLKIQITGKISVTGNSRTRTMIFKHGVTNYSNLSCKCDSSFNIVRTNTGCLGVQFYIFYK